MSTEFTLHQACLADPDDLTARNVYADWLEEFGTTERQAAHCEWLRLTNAKTRKGPNRQPGEPDWLINNARRLWPNLMALNSARVGLRTNAIFFRVLVPTPNGKMAASVVTIHAYRGVAVWSSITWVRQVHTAPLVAADEPLTRIAYSGIPQGTIRSYPGGIAIARAPFEKRAALGVYLRLEGWTAGATLPLGQVAVAYPSSVHKFPQTVAVNALHSALTRYGRDVAKVPHLVPSEPVTPEPKLEVPAKI